jgi:hypothetical protein
VKYQIPSTYHSKVIGKVKVSDRMTEWRNDRMTDRTKTICPPIFDQGDIKTKLSIIVSSIVLLWGNKNYKIKSSHPLHIFGDPG